MRPYFPIAVAMLLSAAAHAQDVEAGAKVFNQCRSCHAVGETAKIMIGPPLNGVVGRKAGTFPSFSYSEANRDSGLTWDEATLTEYLKDPKAKVPKTKMAFGGLKTAQQIADVIAFLKQYDADGKKH